jgi:hypothetical protein
MIGARRRAGPFASVVQSASQQQWCGAARRPSRADEGLRPSVAKQGESLRLGRVRLRHVVAPVQLATELVRLLTGDVQLASDAVQRLPNAVQLWPNAVQL